MKPLPLAIVTVELIGITIAIHHAQAILMLKPASGRYHTPSPTATASVGSCPSGQTFTLGGTTYQTGAECFAAAGLTCPTPSANSVNPANSPYNADKTGVNDSTQAVSQALAAGGDLYFSTPGTYTINFCMDCTGTNAPHNWCTGSQRCSLSNVTDMSGNGLGVVPSANVKILCAAGVTLQTTLTNAQWPNTSDGIFNLKNTGNTICGCTFTNTTNANMSAGAIAGAPGAWLVEIENSGATIEDNIFQNSYGDAAVMVTDQATNAAPNNITVKYNSFYHNSNYGFDTENTTGVNFNHNFSQDGGIGAENDQCTNTVPNVNTHQDFEYNMITQKVGTCVTQPGGPCAGVGYINLSADGPGYPQGVVGCNQSTNTLANNYCVGNPALSSLQNINYSKEYPQASGGANAAYSNNIATNGCLCGPVGQPNQTLSAGQCTLQ